MLEQESLIYSLEHLWYAKRFKINPSENKTHKLRIRYSEDYTNKHGNT